MNNFESKRFSISLSFPGEYRDFVEKIADHLANTVTKNRVLYDKYFEAEFARLDLDVYLPNLYRSESELVVIFLCPEYKKKRWCKLEWRFIKQLISTINQDRIMLVSFGEPGDLTDLGILPGDGYLNIGTRQPEEIAKLILKRYAQNEVRSNNQLQQSKQLSIEPNSSPVSDNPGSVGIVEAVHLEMDKRKKIKVTILSPVNGEECPHSVPMQGEVFNLPDGKELWIIKEPHPDNFHPDTGPIFVDGQKWIGTAFIGNKIANADTGIRFKVHIVVCDAETGKKFKNYLDNGHRTGGWGGLPTYLDAIIVATVEVVRNDSVKHKKEQPITIKTESEKIQRPFLERASWIAGVISAVIALIVWLGPFSHQQVETSAQKPLPLKEENIRISQVQNNVPESAKATLSERWSCGAVTQDLQPAFEAAKNISYYATKDEALLAIAKKALCIHNFLMFEKIANEISYYSTKDQAFADAVDFTLEIKQFELANKYARQISYYSTKDDAQKRIAFKATQK